MKGKRFLSLLAAVMMTMLVVLPAGGLAEEDPVGEIQEILTENGVSAVAEEPEEKASEVEEPAAEETTSEESATDESDSEEPASEDATSDESEVEESDSEEPASVDTTSDESEVEGSVSEETTASEDTTSDGSEVEGSDSEETTASEDTTTDESEGEESVSEEPTAEDTTTDESKVEGSVSEETAAEDTTTDESEVEESVSEETAAEEAPEEYVIFIVTDPVLFDVDPSEYSWLVSQNTSGIAAIMVQGGELLSKPADLNVPGYEFDGRWYLEYKNGTFNKEWDFDEDYVTGQMVLYAGLVKVEEEVTEEAPAEEVTEETSEEVSAEEVTEESTEEVPAEEATEEATEEESAEEAVEEGTEETPAEEVTEGLVSHYEGSGEELPEAPTEVPTEAPTEEPVEETAEETPAEEVTEETTEETPAEEATKEVSEEKTEEAVEETVQLAKKEDAKKEQIYDASNPPKITTQPKVQTVYAGNKLALSIAATGAADRGTLVYQWQYQDASGTWVNWAKGKTLKKKMLVEWDGRNVRCVVSNKNGETISNVVTLNLSLKIVSQPASVSAKLKQTFTMSVVAYSAVDQSKLTYTWYYIPKGKTEADKVKFKNQTTATLTAKMTSALNGASVFCVVKDSKKKTVTSAYATVTKIANSSTALKITQEPEPQIVKVKNKIKMTVKANGSGLTYQWQYKYPSSDEWKNWGSSNTTGKLSKTMKASYDGLLVRCVVTNNKGKTVTSREVSVQLPAVITVQPESKSLLKGDQYELSVVVDNRVAGGTVTYQWYKAGKKWSKKTSATVSGKMTKALNGTEFYCKIVVKDANGKKVVDLTTQTVTLSLTPTKLAYVTQPASQTLLAGEKFTFKPETTGTDVDYQWQYQKDGGEWTNFENGTSYAFTSTMTVDMDGMKVRCLIAEKGGTPYLASNEATLTLKTVTVDHVKYKQVTSGSTNFSVIGTDGSAGAEVTVYAKINGFSVTTIAKGAFEGNTTLTSIKLPDSIEVIGAQAFKGCTKLASMSAFNGEYNTNE